MASEHDIASEVFQIKGRLLQGTASATDRELLGAALASGNPLIRLIAASVVIAQGATGLAQEALTVVTTAIRRNEIGGRFPQALFWEAMTSIPLDLIDQEALLDVVQAHVDDPYTDRINVAFLLRRLSKIGSTRALSLLPLYEPS